MKKENRTQMLLTAFAVLLVIILVMGVYIRQVNMMLEKATLGTMREISSHDEAFVENTLDRSWLSLERVAERLKLGHASSVQELQQALNVEQRASSFKNLYLIDKEGRMYSGAFLIRDGKQYQYVRDILSGTAKTVRRMDEYDYRVDDQEESLQYAVSIEPMEIEGITFAGIVGQTKIRDMREHMSLTSFGGAGLSIVIDMNGDFVVNEADLSGIGDRENLFSQMDGVRFRDGYSLERLRADMAAGKDISAAYRLQDKDNVLYMRPLEHSDWYIIVKVPVSVFTVQSRQFVLMTGVLLLIILFTVLLLLRYTAKAREATLAAQANADAESEFLSRMSHEIRTPLNAMIGLNYLMGQNLHDIAKLSGYLEKSDRTSRYLLSLINDILDISKLRQKKGEISMQVFSVPELAELLEIMMKEKMNEKGIRFSTELSVRHPYILGDEMRLKQVILNILSNAVKFTAAGGSISMTITQRSADTEGKVVTEFVIADNGIGMSREFQKHIFETFRQENRPEATGVQGTGLGMSISYLLMQQMGGTIRVKSEVGEGSTFTVSLPAETAPSPETAGKLTTAETTAETTTEATETTTETKAEVKAEAVRKFRVLVAEDNALNASILVSILEGHGFSAAVAENGRKAVSEFMHSEQGAFGVILMDAQMPELDGYAAAREIRALDRADAGAVRIYACTANTSQADRERAREAGMDGFLAKPIDVYALFEILDGKNRGWRG